MPITLPEARAIKVDRPRLLDFGGRQVPAGGGAVQPLLRLGTRWALDVTIPLMSTEPDGRIWASRLCQAKLAGALMWFRQDGLDIGLPALSGTPLVMGAGQSGSTLAIDSLRPGYVIREGQFFSIFHGTRHYLHQSTAIVVANSSGQASVPIFPMLRIFPADNAPCHFAKPMIQGSLTGSNEQAWTRLAANWTDLGSISISEDE